MTRQQFIQECSAIRHNGEPLQPIPFMIGYAYPTVNRYDGYIYFYRGHVYTYFSSLRINTDILAKYRRFDSILAAKTALASQRALMTIGTWRIPTYTFTNAYMLRPESPSFTSNRNNTWTTHFFPADETE